MEFKFLLFEYLTSRAEVTGADFNLSISEIENLFESGFRNFSGVEVNEFYFPCWDYDEPRTHKGFLNAFICYFISKNYSPKIPKNPISQKNGSRF